MATLIEVSKILAGAMPLYPNFKRPTEINSQTGKREGSELDFYLKTWLRYVGHLDAGTLQSAMDKAVINHPDFMPTPGHVLEAVGQIATGTPRTGLEAWGDVSRAMSKHGNYHPPKGQLFVLMANNYEWQFDDPLVGDAVAAIGWQELFDGHEDTMRAHFIRAYETMRLREIKRSQDLLAVPAPEHGDRVTRLLSEPAPTADTERQKRMAEFTARIGAPK